MLKSSGPSSSTSSSAAGGLEGVIFGSFTLPGVSFISSDEAGDAACAGRGLFSTAGCAVGVVVCGASCAGDSLAVWGTGEEAVSGGVDGSVSAVAGSFGGVGKSNVVEGSGAGAADCGAVGVDVGAGAGCVTGTAGGAVVTVEEGVLGGATGGAVAVAGFATVAAGGSGSISNPGSSNNSCCAGAGGAEADGGVSSMTSSGNSFAGGVADSS